MRWLVCLTAIMMFGSVATAAERTPRIVECTADVLILRTTGERVSLEQLQQADNRFEKMLAEVEANRTELYLMFLVRPGSVKLFRAARKTAAQRPIDVGYDVDEPVVKSKPNGAFFKKSTVQTDNRRGVFFECRSNQVFFVDKEWLEKKVEQRMNTMESGVNSIPRLFRDEIANEYYKVLPAFLLDMTLAFEPKPGTRGDDLAQLKQPDCRYRTVLSKLNERNNFVHFFVRDDNSFPVFRQARAIAQNNRLETGWELLTSDEPLKFRIPSTGLAP